MVVSPPEYQDTYGEWSVTVPVTVTNHTTASIDTYFQGQETWNVPAPADSPWEGGPQTMPFLNGADSDPALLSGKSTAANGWLGVEARSQPTPMDSVTFTDFAWADVSSDVGCPAPRVTVTGWQYDL